MIKKYRVEASNGGKFTVMARLMTIFTSTRTFTSFTKGCVVDLNEEEVKKIKTQPDLVVTEIPVN